MHRMSGALWVLAIAVFAVSLWMGFAGADDQMYFSIGPVVPVILSFISLVLIVMLKKIHPEEHTTYFAVALMLWFFGELFLYGSSFLPGIDPIYADLFWIGGYVPLAAGLWSVSKRVDTHRDFVQAVSLFLLLTAYIVITVDAALPFSEDLGLMANIVHPIASIILFTLAAYIVTGNGEARCITAIAASMLLFSVFDIMYLMAMKNGSYEMVARFIDPVYNLGYLAFAYAIYSQTKAINESPKKRQARRKARK